MSLYKKFLLAFFFVSFFFLFPQRTFAQIVINEFSSNSNPEWVELYNTGPSDTDITGWKLVDEANHVEPLTGTVPANGFFVYERPQGWLNNSGGDSISLKDATDGVINSIVYGHNGDGVGTPDADKSSGRVPNGSSNWQTNLTWTKGEDNPVATPSPSPSPTASPSPTPTQTSTSTPTQTPTSTPAKTPTPKPFPTKTPSPTPSSSPEVLGENVIEPSASPTVEVEGQTLEKKKFPFLPVVLIGSGLSMVVLAVLQLINAAKGNKTDSPLAPPDNMGGSNI